LAAISDVQKKQLVMDMHQLRQEAIGRGFSYGS
jgi:hypothetical protein